MKGKAEECHSPHDSLLQGAAQTKSFNGIQVRLHGQVQPVQEMGIEGWASLSPQQQRKWVHTGIIHSLPLYLQGPLMLNYLSA